MRAEALVCRNCPITFQSSLPDARLQRPEYLGGGSTPVKSPQLQQTSSGASGTTTPLGNLASFATAAQSWAWI